MPGEDRTTKTGEHCDLHPGNASVGRCSECGRTLCLDCAIPVRGSLLGAECLAGVLGPDPPIPPPPPERRQEAASRVVGAAFAVAVAASALPWTKFRTGSRVFGAWGGFRWSTSSALAAATGLLLWWLFRSWSPGTLHARALVLSALGLMMAAAAILAILNPPPYTRASGAPWLVFAAGLVTITACWRSARRARSAHDQAS